MKNDSKIQFIKKHTDLCPYCKKCGMKLNKGCKPNPFHSYLCCPLCGIVIGLDPEINWKKIFGL